MSWDNVVLLPLIRNNKSSGFETNQLTDPTYSIVRKKILGNLRLKVSCLKRHSNSSKVMTFLVKKERLKNTYLILEME